jgi:hypothetical protein
VGMTVLRGVPLLRENEFFNCEEQKANYRHYRAGGNLPIQQQKLYRLKFMHYRRSFEVPTFVGMTFLRGNGSRPIHKQAYL